MVLKSKRKYNSGRKRPKCGWKPNWIWNLETMQVTAIVHIFNEEYLLPFWIEHHKQYFSHTIFVDYSSTDRSVEIIRELAPSWEVRTSRNTEWSAQTDDDEVIEIERTVAGFKIALNITDFFVPNEPIEGILARGPAQKLHVFTVSSTRDEDQPANASELLAGIEKADPERRGYRFLHSFPDGKYQLGRHDSHLQCVWSNAQIVWLGFYPWNETLLRRKLQFGARLARCDSDMGAGVHHLWSRETMIHNRNELVKNLSDVSKYTDLYRTLQSTR